MNVSSNAERPVGISSEGAVPQRPRSPVTLILLVSGLTGALLCVARGAFIPVALAVLFPRAGGWNGQSLVGAGTAMVGGCAPHVPGHSKKARTRRPSHASDRCCH